MATISSLETRKPAGAGQAGGLRDGDELWAVYTISNRNCMGSNREQRCSGEKFNSSRSAPNRSDRLLNRVWYNLSDAMSDARQCVAVSCFVLIGWQLDMLSDHVSDLRPDKIPPSLEGGLSDCQWSAVMGWT